MTVGWIPTMFIGLLIFSLIFIGTGPIVDELIPVWNDMGTNGIPQSQTANWTFSGLLGLFGAECYMILMTFGINGLMNAVQSRDGTVSGAGPTSVLLTNVVSLVGILSLIVVMLCISPVVDLFADFATTLQIVDPTMMYSMGSMVKFADYTYWVIFLIGVCFFLTPLANLWRIHGYTAESADRSTMREESSW